MYFCDNSNFNIQHLKTTVRKILIKESYSKPEITRIILDNSISLVMMTTMPPNPPPRGRTKSDDGTATDSPFTSPFGDKPFE